MAAQKPSKRVGRPPKDPEAKAETFSIRLVPELRARLEEAAEQERRSLAAEIVFRLESSFSVPLTYLLVERRIAEFEKVKATIVDMDTVLALTNQRLSEIKSSRAPEQVAERIRLQADIEKATSKRNIATGQLARIEAEVDALLEDLGKRINADIPEPKQ